MLNILDSHPVLLINPYLDKKSGQEEALHKIEEALSKDLRIPVIEARFPDEAILTFRGHTEIGCVLVKWFDKEDIENCELNSEDIINEIRRMNDIVPIFILTEKHKLKEIKTGVLEKVNGYIWQMEDTPSFIAGRIQEAIIKYLDLLYPPFFKELSKYVKEFKYAWHTPGHMGGLAFLRSPVGRLFYNFFGENMFRADLSVSVPELGSLLEHTGVNKKSEELAAKVFNADYTFYVTNGTSTANKIVNHSCVKRGDVVLIDRNCHKSLQHAITMTGAIPIYFLPSRNVYGIIGGISLNQFDEKEIRQKVKDNPLIKNKNVKIKLAVITNSTYDGLIYDTVKIKDKLGKVVDNLHFDEAWYSYARFHKIYDNRYAMTDNHDEKKHPTLYSTQSTHKLLAALSQSSMLHVKSGKNKINFDTFNEAFMMHTSTSPQYLIIASLDVAAKMMEGSKGKELMDDLIEEAITFRKKMVQMRNEILQEANDAERLWWFDIWQPSTVEVRLKKIVYMNFLNIEQKKLTNYSNYWTLKKDDKWHCFKNIDDEFMMLDPIKVTFITPGISRDGNMANWGIPAFIVSKYLITRGIVDEKTGFYTFLALFSLGVTKGKSSILISALIDFKKLYDENVLIEEYVPKFIDKYPIYKDIRLKELCNKMHLFLKKNDISNLTTKVFEIMPKPIMTPCEAYEKLIEKEIEEVPLDKLINRTPAVMLVPYPPGIPIIMPGEKITTKEKCLIDYLKFLENFDNKFPGFETETHGLIIKKEKGRIKYYVNCLK